MTFFKQGILGLNHTTSIDDGTLARTSTSCPGINSLEVDSYGHSILRREAKEINDRWQRAEEHDKKFLKILRDSIIDYQVNKRIESLSANMKDKIRCKIKGEITYVRKKYRALNKIDSLVLHQTSGPERKLTIYHDFSVHFVIVPDGTIYQMHDESVYCYGSSRLNSRSVAVEFVGHFKKDNGKWAQNPKLHSELTKKQIDGGRTLVRYLKRKLDIKYVLAHVQAANKNCPGPEIWFNVGEWAIKNGLSADGTNITVSGGKRVPIKWRDKKWDFNNRLLAPDF
jgi:hypothetical protein